jgi:hypothetical protein
MRETEEEGVHEECSREREKEAVNEECMREREEEAVLVECMKRGNAENRRTVYDTRMYEECIL